jgi:hypothetical protein
VWTGTNNTETLGDPVVLIGGLHHSFWISSIGKHMGLSDLFYLLDLTLLLKLNYYIASQSTKILVILLNAVAVLQV